MARSAAQIEREQTSGDFEFTIKGAVTGGTNNILALLDDVQAWIREGKLREDGEAHFGDVTLRIHRTRPARGPRPVAEALGE